MSGRRIKLPAPAAAIYKAVRELETCYPERKFTPDGHLVGSIGEVIAAEALNLKLLPMSHAGHDACDANGLVQAKMTAGTSISMYDCCVRLVVLRVISPEETEVLFTTALESPLGSTGEKAEERAAYNQPFQTAKTGLYPN